MRTYLILGLSFALPFATGCGDDSTPTLDSGADTGTADTSTGDTGSDDAATDAPVADAPLADAPMDDAPVADAPMDDAPMADAPTRDTGDACDTLLLGMRCESADSCGREYQCDRDTSRCVPPDDRPGCGGFAGAMCTTRAFPECAFLPGADFGPCLSTEEADCLCDGDLYTCTGRTRE